MLKSGTIWLSDNCIVIFFSCAQTVNLITKKSIYQQNIQLRIVYTTDTADISLSKIYNRQIKLFSSNSYIQNKAIKQDLILNDLRGLICHQISTKLNRIS